MPPSSWPWVWWRSDVLSVNWYWVLPAALGWMRKIFSKKEDKIVFSVVFAVNAKDSYSSIFLPRVSKYSDTDWSSWEVLWAAEQMSVELFFYTIQQSVRHRLDDYQPAIVFSFLKHTRNKDTFLRRIASAFQDTWDMATVEWVIQSVSPTVSQWMPCNLHEKAWPQTGTWWLGLSSSCVVQHSPVFTLFTIFALSALLPSLPAHYCPLLSWLGLSQSVPSSCHPVHRGEK